MNKGYRNKVYLMASVLAVIFGQLVCFASAVGPIYLSNVSIYDPIIDENTTIGYQVAVEIVNNIAESPGETSAVENQYDGSVWAVYPGKGMLTEFNIGADRLVSIKAAGTTDSITIPANCTTCRRLDDGKWKCH